jgi:hypothetical protein
MRTNLGCVGTNTKPQKMKMKILVMAAFAIASATLLAGCIDINVNKTASPSCCSPGKSCGSTNCTMAACKVTMPTNSMEMPAAK